MNQRRYIEHNLFLQSAYTKHINQVLLKSCSSLNQVLLNILLNISLRSCSGLAQVLLRSCSSHVKVLTQHLTQVLHNISPRNFNEFGNAFFYS